MSWLVVYTASRSEYLAWSQMRAAGFEPWYPVRKWRQRDKRGSGERWGPLFPRYVLVQKHPMWAMIASYRGVIGFLMSERDDKPREISNYVIEDIRQRQAAGEFDEKPAPKLRRPSSKSFHDLRKLLGLVDRREAA